MEETPLFILEEYIKEFLGCQQREFMLAGQRYYDCENDILFTNKDIKLAHGFMANMIDEKVQYLLGKEFTLECKDQTYIKKVEKTLGESILYNLQDVAIEASNKGIAWWQIYFNKEGELKYMLIPSEQCCPIWKGNIQHKELEGMLRIYDVETYIGSNSKKDVTHVEYYEKDGVSYYIYEHGRLVLDSEKYFNVPEELKKAGHYIKNGKHLSFGIVPFIWCKNNRRELPDLKFVKTLIDEYDKSRGDVAQLLEDCRNWIAAITNYEGDAENDDIMQLIKEKRRVFVDTDGSVDILTPKIDTAAAESHGKQLKEDITLLGKTVARDSEKMGSIPSGKAFKFMYAGIDIKCNNIEQELKNMFRQVLKFIEIGLGIRSDEKIDIIFNRDVMINESEVIADCKNSVGILSEQTIIANHPYVKDVAEEIRRKKAEEKKDKQEEDPYDDVFSKVGTDDEQREA